MVSTRTQDLPPISKRVRSEPKKYSERVMLKISIAMVVTATFAGLLIYNPYEVSSNSPARLTNMQPRFANGLTAIAQAEIAAAEEAPTTLKPQDIEGIVLKVLADRVVPQERNCSGTVAVPMPEKPAATVEQRLLSASNGSQQRPAPQCAAETPVVQPVWGRYEDPLISSMNGALPDRTIASVVRPVLVKHKVVSRADRHLRPVRRARVGKAETHAVQPVLGRLEDTAVSGTYGALPDKPIATVAQGPTPASNGARQQPVAETAAQMPVVRPALGTRKGASRVDGHLRLWRAREER